MTNALDARKIIKLLRLKRLQGEGGYYCETYRSTESIPARAAPARYRGKRSQATAIYYLLTAGTFSAVHRLKSDEVFHFYAGDPVEMLLLGPGTKGRTVMLGVDLASGQRPQMTVPRGVWQGARLVRNGKWALLGTTVAPGFEYADFELGKRAKLMRSFPCQAELITALTKE